MVLFVTHSTPAGHHYDAVDRLASRFATKRRSQRARAGLSSLLCKGCGAALGLRANSSGAHRETHNTAASTRKIPDPCGHRERAERRADGPTDAKKAPPVVASRRPHRGSAGRPTPHKAGRTLHTRVPRARHAPRKPLTLAPPPAAVAQDLPHEADAREEDGPEPAHPPVDPHAHGQQDPLELEAAALAPHEARPLS